MTDTDINKVIEDFSNLPPDDKEYVAEIIRKQVIELKRERLVQRAEKARESFEKGEVKTGALSELMEDIDRD